MSDPTELPPELAALYASERAEACAPARLRDEIRVAVATTLGISIAVSGTTAGAAGAAGASGAATVAGGASGLVAGTTTKLVLVVAVAGAIGGGARVLLDREPAPTKPAAPVVEHRRAAVTAPMPRPPARSSAGDAEVPDLLSKPPMQEQPAQRPAPARSTRSRTFSSGVDQRGLITQAWSALRRGERAEALVLVERALALGPGPLDEERDALHIHLLQQLGRADDASRLAREFRHRYPHSIHDGLVTPVKESP